MDEEDDEFDLDPDEFNARAVDNSDEEGEDFVEGGSDRKKKKLKTEQEKNGQVGKEEEEAKAAKAAKKARRKEMDRIYKEITSMPAPGCLDTKDVTPMSLLNVLCLTDKNALRPIVVSYSLLFFNFQLSLFSFQLTLFSFHKIRTNETLLAAS